MNHRVTEILRALEELGFEAVLVHLVRRDDVREFAAPSKNLRVLRIYGGVLDGLLGRALFHWNALTGRERRYSDPMHVELSSRFRLRAFSRREHVTVAVVLHARNVGAIQRLPASVCRILDLPDLMSENSQHLRFLTRILGSAPWTTGMFDNVSLNESFSSDGLAEIRELDACSAFDGVVAVAQEEVKFINNYYAREICRWAPMVMSPVARPHDDDGYTVLFVCSSSLFNVQAYAWLVRDVLPTLRSSGTPFVLRLVGRGSETLPPSPDVELVGPVGDLGSAYAGASVVVCPTRQGTGQPVKGIEAMAHGCPTVMTRFVANRSGAIDGKTCLVADDGLAFADAILCLLRDGHRRRRLGHSAGEEAARKYSEFPLRTAISAVLSEGVGTGGRSETS